MKKILFYLLFQCSLFLLPFSGRSQVINRDSLLQLLPTLADDSNKVNCLTNICFSYVGRNDDSILFYVKKLEEVAGKINHPKGLMNVQNMNGMVHMNKGNLKSALERYTSMLEIAEKNNIVRGKNIALINMSGILIKLKEFEKALDNYYKLIPALEKNNDKKNMLFVYMNMAIAFAEKKEYDSSIAYNQRAYVIAEEFKQFHSQIEILDNTGSVFSSKGVWDSAGYYYKRALALIEREKMYDLKKRVLFNMALLKHTTSTAKDTALIEFHKVLSLMDTGRRDVTLISETYTALTNHFERIKEYDSAFYYLRKQNEMSKKIFTDSLNMNANEMYVKYQAEIKQKKIELLENDAKLKEMAIKKEAQRKYFAVIGLVSVLLIGGYIFYLYSRKKALNNRLSSSIAELKQTQAQLIQLEKEKEAEAIRLRISRDIHDDIGSSLTKIAMLGSLTSTQVKDKLPEVSDQLGKISDYARSVNNSMSEIIWAVNPKQDTLENLLGYMRVHTQEFLKDSSIHYKINFPETVPHLQLNPNLKRSLFLVLKESLNNTLKHAGAKNIHITFAIERLNTFTFTVADDGAGFTLQTSTQSKSGNGLVNLQQRVEQAGCSFNIATAPGSGCTVLVKGSL